MNEEIAGSKGVIRIRKSKDRQPNDQERKMYNETNNDLQKIHRKLTIEKHKPL